MIPLDIYSDPICPWCYIGKAHLNRALETRPDHPFEIRWHPFQLNPDMAPEGMDRAEYMALKFGDDQAILAAYGPVIEAAEGAGLSLNLPAITRTPNTLDAHRLIHWAGLEGRQSATVAALFRAYFAQGRDIGERATLLELARDSGLDTALITRLMDTDADADLIREADRMARARGITGVPFFIIDKQYAVSGAQPVQVWQNVIDELTAGPPA